ncbi:MAG TPA: DUF4129 domain-containing protein [Candidatus Angelobacter sp.]|nr:DUF4129 domain-containing protein [Candidatus Angelobacter sp.]
MKRRFWKLTPLLLSLLCACSVRALAGSLSLEEYRGQLRGLEADLHSLRDHPDRARTVETALPDTVSVKAGAKEINVSYRDLKIDLSMFIRADAARRATLSSQLEDYVRRLKSQAEAYSESGYDPVQAQQKLQAILARREFRDAHSSPSMVNVFLAKVFAWILRFLARLPFGPSTFSLFQLLVYSLVAIALALLLWWTIRRLRRRPEESGRREIVPFSPSARSWRTWLAEARSLAQGQDWRGAIHLAYWAGISFLEEHGSWRPNRARTPREYLQLLTSRNPNYPALSSLTSKFEVVWYGRQQALESDFEETLGQLEKLGCR